MKVYITLILFLFGISINSFSKEPREAYDMVQKGEAVLIDVREISELSEGMIENAMWFPKSEMIPGSEVLDDFKAVTRDKKVFVYCQAGKRAEACKDILQKEGVDAESLGGYNKLKNILPTKTIFQRVNEPLQNSQASNRKSK